MITFFRASRTDTFEKLLFLGLSFLNAVTGVLIVTSNWQRWSEPKVDTYQTYMASELLYRGAGVLYKDIQYFFGPFAPYFNSFVLNIFGNRAETFWGIGLLSALLIVILIYQLVRKHAGPIAAQLGVFLFFTLCLYSNPWGYVANNYIAPYSYSSSFSAIGLILTLMAILGKKEKKEKNLLWFLAGIMIFLNRVELGLILLAGIILFQLFFGKVITKKELALWTLPSFLVLIIFAIIAGPKKLLLDNLFWPPHLPFNPYTAYTASVLGVGFYTISQYTISFFLNILPLSFVLIFRGKRQTLGLILSAVSALVGIIFLDHLEITLAIPFMIFTFLISGFVKRKEISHSEIYLLATFFALLPTVRIILNFNIGGYFFYLGVPAIAMMMIICFEIIPQLASLHSQSKRIYTMIFVAFYLSAGFKAYTITKEANKSIQQEHTFTKANMILNYQDENIAKTIKWIEANTPLDSSVHVIPEGAGITYFSGRKWIIPRAHTLATDIKYYGQDFLIKELEKYRPDYIVIVNDYRPFYGKGNELFSVDYGQGILAWVDEHYQVVKQFGEEFPIVDFKSDSVMIYEKRSQDKARKTP